MMFESTYRRQAMAKWQQSKEEEWKQLELEWVAAREGACKLKRVLMDLTALLMNRWNKPV